MSCSSPRLSSGSDSFHGGPDTQGSQWVCPSFTTGEGNRGHVGKIDFSCQWDQVTGVKLLAQQSCSLPRKYKLKLPRCEFLCRATSQLVFRHKTEAARIIFLSCSAHTLLWHRHYLTKRLVEESNCLTVVLDCLWNTTTIKHTHMPSFDRAWRQMMWKMNSVCFCFVFSSFLKHNCLLPLLLRRGHKCIPYPPHVLC